MSENSVFILVEKQKHKPLFQAAAMLPSTKVSQKVFNYLIPLSLKK